MRVQPTVKVVVDSEPAWQGAAAPRPIRPLVSFGGRRKHDAFGCGNAPRGPIDRSDRDRSSSRRGGGNGRAAAGTTASNRAAVALRDLFPAGNSDMVQRTHLLALMASLEIQVACATRRFPAAAVVFGERIDTTMDSPAAAYYLGSHFGGTRNNPALDEKIDRLHARAPADRLPHRDELLVVAGEFSTDFAALFFADRVRRQIENARVYAMFADYLSAPKDGADLLAPSDGRYVILFAPGWDCISNRSATGAPSRTRDDSSPRSASRTISPNWPRTAPSKRTPGKSCKRSIAPWRATSASSSSAPAQREQRSISRSDAIKAAGARAPAAWLNLGGSLQGSPLIEHVGRFLLSAYRGRPSNR